MFVLYATKFRERRVAQSLPPAMRRGDDAPTEWIGSATMWRIAMGTRQSEQASMWVATAELPKSPGHPFYTRLNALLDADDFGRFVEGQCAKFYAPVMGRPSRSARLQWGRAHVSAEMVEVAISFSDAYNASMGPRSRERGNTGILASDREAGGASMGPVAPSTQFSKTFGPPCELCRLRA